MPTTRLSGKNDVNDVDRSRTWVVNIGYPERSLSTDRHAYLAGKSHLVLVINLERSVPIMVR